MKEIFEYRFTKLDPIGGDHIDPPTMAIYETLLNKGPDEQALPGLADSWQVSQDGLRWRFHLRRGATFHSGDVCDAAAVRGALERCRWGDGRGRQLWYWDPVDEVVDIDPGTLELRLHYPYLGLPTLLWGTHTAICNVKRRDALGSDYGIASADGTGLWQLVKYSPDEVVARLTPRGASGPLGLPETITWLAAPSEDERCSFLHANDVDVVRAVPGPAVAGRVGPRWRFREQPEVSQVYLALNFDAPQGFADRRLRQAIEAFIDRDALVSKAFSGHGDGRRSPVPAAGRFSSSFDAQSSRPMPREEALRVVAEAGGPSGGTAGSAGPGVRLRAHCVAQDTEPFRRLAAELNAQLQPAGVQFDFRFMEPFEPFYRACNERPEAFLSKWLWQDALEAVMGFSRASCAEEGPNWQGARTPPVDKAYDRFLQASSAELEGASEAAQRAFMEELPYIPLCSPTETFAVAGSLEGYGPVPGTLYPLYGNVRSARG